ncbi:threonine/serine ThrE exporter family protein [Pseudonocardia sp.]|uniref:threonine/serine ThrE exporter family protein n=1 Tax=Pseudonocardia sp. TaxID=60912 RepID=UPI003D1289C3
MTRFDRGLRHALRREAREMLRGGPPTAPLLQPVGPGGPSDEHVLRVLDLCMRVGEVLLSSGEAAADTSATMTRLAAACGLTTVDVDITFTSITMCCHRERTAPSVLSMRLVRYRTTDLTRLDLVTRIVDQVVRGRMDVRAADAALAEAVAASHPFPRWVATAGWAGLAAAVALLLGGPPVIWLTAFLVTAVIDRVGRLLARWGVAPFFLQMIGGLVATVSTLGLLAVGALPPGTEPSLVIAASITVLLSGFSVVGTVQDAVSGHVVTAAGRAVEVAVLSAGLLTGVILGLKVGIALRLTLDPAELVVADVGRFGISTFAAATAAAMAALACYAPLRSLPAAALAGGIGWAAYGALTQFPGIGPVVATGLAAVVVGVASELFRRGARVHRHVIILSGIIPLLPGLAAYRGFYQLASAQAEDAANGLVTITLALAIGLALAAGVALGQFIARPRPAPDVAEPATRPREEPADGPGFGHGSRPVP